MCMLHLMTWHPTQNWSRNCSALIITEISKISVWFWRKERGCPLKANYKPTDCYNHCRTLGLNMHLEDLFHLWWINASAIPMSSTFIFYIYPDSCLKLQTDCWWQGMQVASSQLSVSSGSYPVTDLLSGR